jgi:hypothetical protein
MSNGFDPHDWNAALVQLKNAANAEDASAGPSLRQRDEFRVKVIEARVKLKLMRDRTEALQQSLERFRSRRDAMRA